LESIFKNIEMYSNLDELDEEIEYYVDDDKVREEIDYNLKQPRQYGNLVYCKIN